MFNCFGVLLKKSNIIRTFFSQIGFKSIRSVLYNHSLIIKTKWVRNYKAEANISSTAGIRTAKRGLACGEGCFCVGLNAVLTYYAC